MRTSRVVETPPDIHGPEQVEALIIGAIASFEPSVARVTPDVSHCVTVEDLVALVTARS